MGVLRIANRIATAKSPLSLTLALQRPYTCIGLDEYNLAQNAFSIPVDMPSQLLLCPGEEVWEVDWLALEAPEMASRGQLVVVGTYEDFELNVVLFELEENENGALQTTPVRRAVKSASRRWEIDFDADPSKRYVVRISTDEELRRMFAPNFYTISYIYPER